MVRNRWISCAVGLTLTAGAARAELGSFLKPADFNGRVGGQVKLQFYSGRFTDAKAADWPRERVDWLFIRVAGTQRNLEKRQAAPASPRVQFVQLPLEHAGTTMIGTDVTTPTQPMPPRDFSKLLEKTANPTAYDGQPRPGGNNAVRVRHVDSSKTLIRVGGDREHSGHSGVATSKSGQVAEIRLMADPARTPVGSDLPFRVYLHGSPKAHVTVIATSAAANTTVELTTNASGFAHLRVTSEGPWMLDCWHAEAATAEPDVDWITYRSTFTFEIGGSP